jgi:RNA polymerase sigma factor (sigma-70 family)
LIHFGVESAVAFLPPFQSLIDSHGRDVHRFLIANVGPVDADDCWQETWLSALRAYPSLQDATNLRAWLFTIAHRKAIDHARARGRRAIPVAEAVELADAAPTGPGRIGAGRAGAGVTAAGVGAAGLLGTAASAADPLRDEELWTSVAQLPDKQRVAVTLRFVADSAYAEIGEVMGTSEQAARRNVHEALKRLRKELDR